MLFIFSQLQFGKKLSGFVADLAWFYRKVITRSEARKSTFFTADQKFADVWWFFRSFLLHYPRSCTTRVVVGGEVRL